MPSTAAQRQRLHADRARWAREALARAERLPAHEARALYHAEKAKSEARNAAKRAELARRCKDAIARADAEAEKVRRGGRPKGAKPRGPSISVWGRSKLDLLRESRPGGTL